MNIVRALSFLPTVYLLSITKSLHALKHAGNAHPWLLEANRLPKPCQEEISL